MPHPDTYKEISGKLLLHNIKNLHGMMWALAIKRKITAALLLLSVVGLVLLTNWSEQRNARRIAAAVTTIYEDRLVVEGYIFRLYTYYLSYR